MYCGKIRIFVLAALMTVTCSVTGCGKSKNAEIDTADGVTNILDYVTVDFAGDNGEGTAYVQVDYDGMETEMVGGEEEIKKMDDIGDLSELTKYINAVSSITLNIDKNSGLSNGDTVTVSVTYDSSAAESAGVVFGEEGSKSFEVKGLR